MRQTYQPSTAQTRAGHLDRPSTAFTSEEKRRIFKSMVVGELEAGFLRYSRREELIRYAAHLGISEFDAMLLIAEAQHRAAEIEPLRFDSSATLGTCTRPETWSVSMRVSFALVAAVFIDLLLIYWLCA